MFYDIFNISRMKQTFEGGGVFVKSYNILFNVLSRFMLFPISLETQIVGVVCVCVCVGGGGVFLSKKKPSYFMFSMGR